MAREARLAWAGAALGVYVGSYKELTEAQASQLIEKIQQHLPPELLRRSPNRKSRHRRSRKPGAIAIDRARSAPTGAQMELITTRLGELGRTREWLDAWLASGRTAPCRAIRTQRDADRVLNALANMLRRSKASAISSQPTAQPEEVLV